jgi:hypothetical protein
MTKVKERVLLAHILHHLEANDIGSDRCESAGGGWYCGNKEQFIKRHKMAMEYIINRMGELE